MRLRCGTKLFDSGWGGPFMGNIVVLGIPSCSSLPLAGNDNKESSLSLLGSQSVVIGDGVWLDQCLEISLTIPESRIEGILIGGGIGSPPNKYLLFDEIFIDTVTKVRLCDINCCDSVQVLSLNSCCSKITSYCNVNSINIQLSNGIISSTQWNCGALPLNFIDRTQFTFIPSTSCLLDMDLCINPITPGPVTITYNIIFDDGSTCIKTETKTVHVRV